MEQREALRLALVERAKEARKNCQNQSDNKAHLDYKHDRVFDHVAGVQLFKRTKECLV